MLVGQTGFEPATPSPPDWCATKLRYCPSPNFRSQSSAEVHAGPTSSKLYEAKIGRTRGESGIHDNRTAVVASSRLKAIGGNAARINNDIEAIM